jgi:cellulose synthase operon protein C
MRTTLAPLFLIAALALAGCESAEEKAARYFASGMQLLEAGDEERALVEFRNVFKYDGFHKEARKTYADVQLRRGEEREAYSQYLRLVEQYPDTVEVRQTLTELAVRRGDWSEAERHGREAVRLAPDQPGVQAIKIALDYRAAVLAKDAVAGTAAADAAKALLETTPDNMVLRRVLIDYLMGGPDPAAALPIIDAALVQDPKAIEFHMLKTKLLAETEDVPGMGAQLKTMFQLFPDNQEVKTALIGWYLAQKDIAGAEAFLRQIAGEATASPDGHLAVIQLLQATSTPEAVRTELERLHAANEGTPNAELYGALIATVDFEAGKTAEAILAIETILKSAEPTDQTRRIKIMLARMHDVTENRVGARALVEEILLEDATNVDALKLRAGWFIDEDRPGEAIVDLRAALSQNPRDAMTLTLMAAAHERDGSLDLAGERLAAAVEVSGSGAQESLRYARFLIRQNRPQVAEAVLVDARRVSPGDPQILTALAEQYLRNRDWPRAQEAVDTLRSIGLPEAQQAAQTLQAALLLGQNRTEESLAFLEERAGEGDLSAVATMVQTQIRSGNTADARATLDTALANTPDDTNLQLLSASLSEVEGDLARAEEGYRALIATEPAAEVPVRLLYGLLAAQGKAAEATAVLQAGIAAAPTSATLLWIQAGEHERAGDIDAAIAVYEGLYARDSGNVVIANNLASLISTHKADAASLERAFAVARRLRGSDVPAFQDTYGWIEYRRGNLDEALANLEPAAKGLPDDALAQFHLGMTYAALGRKDQAITQLGLALDAAGDSQLPQFDVARAAIETLKAGGTVPVPVPTPAAEN